MAIQWQGNFAGFLQHFWGAVCQPFWRLQTKAYPFSSGFVLSSIPRGRLGLLQRLFGWLLGCMVVNCIMVNWEQFVRCSWLGSLLFWIIAGCMMVVGSVLVATLSPTIVLEKVSCSNLGTHKSGAWNSMRCQLRYAWQPYQITKHCSHWRKQHKPWFWHAQHHREWWQHCNYACKSTENKWEWADTAPDSGGMIGTTLMDGTSFYMWIPMEDILMIYAGQCQMHNLSCWCLACIICFCARNSIIGGF